MNPLDAAALLDQPPLTSAELIELEHLVARTLRTDNAVVVCQAEAITVLESVARSVAGPSHRVLNVVTGPYGALFGNWLRQTGAEVNDLALGYRTAITPDVFARAIAGADTVALVQAEAATGVNLDLPGLLSIAHREGALTVVDAVAAIGGEPLEVDAWGIDVAVLGGQKALSGPAGVSAAAISRRAWERIEGNPAAPRRSTLSLLDWAEDWLRTDRSRIPGTPSVLETRALLGALRRVHIEGIAAVEDRHRRARAATIAGVAALSLEPWAPAGRRAAVCTTVALPDPVPRALRTLTRPGSLIAPGDGPLEAELFRINHFGQAADLNVVLGGLVQLGTALALADRRDEVQQVAAAAWQTYSAIEPGPIGDMRIE